MKKLLLAERSNRHGKAAVLLRQQVRKSNVPCNNGRENAKESTSPLDFEAVSTFEVGDTEESKGDGEEGKESDKGDIGSQSAEPHHESDNGETEEENADSTAHVALVTDVSVANVEPRDENGGVREPEGAVGAEHGGCERVAESEPPHSAQKLGQTAVEEGHPDHHVRR